MNATAAAFQRVASSPSGQHPSNWFNRQSDCGTPIFDQLVAERTGVMEFMHSKIQTELVWPKRQEQDSPETIPDFGFTAGTDLEGSDDDD